MIGGMGDDVDRVAAWRGLLRAHAATVRAIEADLSGRQLMPLGWYDVLLELNGVPKRQLRMQDLAARVTLSRTRVSRIVDELERAGLVERSADPDDGRAYLATITAEGRAGLRRTAPHYLRAIETHFTSLLTDAERQVLVDSLGRVADHHAAAGAQLKRARPAKD